MQLKSSHMICNDDGDIIMGNGRMRILRAIEKTGSINQASKQLKMAYKTVWSKIKSTEKNFGRPVVSTDKIKGTRLTKEGRKLLETYCRFKQQCLEKDDALFEEFFPTID